MPQVSEKDCLETLEGDIGYYDMPEHEDTLPVTGWALCEVMDELKRWRESHKSETFNPDYCAARDALSEHLEHCPNKALQPCAEATTETKRVSDALVQCLVALRKNGMVRDEGDKIIITDPPEAEAMTEDDLVNLVYWNNDSVSDNQDNYLVARQVLQALIQSGHLKVKA